MVAPARRRGGASLGSFASLSLPAHALLLGVVLLAVTWFVGTGGSFSADEGAALVQTEHLADGEGWLLDHPFPEVDPDGTAFPYELSVEADGGWATFAKHPTYPLALAPAYRLLGPTGAVLFSVAGALAAAVLAALLSRRVAPGLEALTLWTVGVASPLLFDSQVVIAHAAGAALAALAALLALNVLEDRRPTLVPLAAASVVGAGLLRNEAVLLGVALALTAAGWAYVRRDRLAAGLAAAVGLAAVVTPSIDQAIAAALVGGSDPAGSGIGSSSGLLGMAVDRIDGAVTTLVTPTYVAGSTRGLLVALAAVTTVSAAGFVRRNLEEERPLVVGLAVVGGTAAVLRLLLGSAGAIPGLLVAFPVLAAGLLVATRSAVATAAARFLAATGGLFALAVVATQYANGGSGEWGGRYFAVGLPLVVPVVLLALREAHGRLDGRTARAWVGGLAATSLAFAGVGVLTLHAAHDGVDAVVDDITATAAHVDPGDGGRPVVVTTAAALPRHAWREVPDARWLLTDGDDPAQLTALADRLHAAGIERFLLVTPEPVRDEAALQDTYTTAAARLVPRSGWYVAEASAS